ncbi:MAG TPA: RNA methyltransferase [Geminicoccaceae bacterium]|nr:RNA methyltransferase [Geminicoccaceae bacterium]
MTEGDGGKQRWPAREAITTRAPAATAPQLRGYFGIGAEGIDKPMNLGNLVRSAHAFGASFVFLIESASSRALATSDTSDSEARLPVYRYGSADELVLPRGCRLVGVELLDEAVDLPSFRHPLNAAYVFGPERSSLSPAMVARCDHVVKIPTRFCINLAVSGAVVMYDRMLSLGRFAPRPVRSGGPTEDPPAHVRGASVCRRAKARG